MRKYKFYSDSGHGWLAVSRRQLVVLNILNKITEYSYQSKSGQTVYLEEDCDASTFLAAEKASLGLIADLNIQDVDHGNRSWIRSMPRFKA